MTNKFRITKFVYSNKDDIYHITCRSVTRVFQRHFVTK